MRKFNRKRLLKNISSKTRRTTAMLLSAVMVFSLFMTIQPLQADGADSIRNYIREADAITMDSYVHASLGGYTYDWSDLDGVSSATRNGSGPWVVNNFGTRFAGEVWADKSVFALGQTVTGAANGDGSFDGKNLTLGKYTDGLDATIALDDYSDFLHVFSVLGSSEQISEFGPYDVVFVVDVSASMAADSNGTEKRPGETDGNGYTYKINDTKMYQAMEALDNSIAMLMELHPENRCAVVLFASRPYVLMDLAHYEPRYDTDGKTIKHYEDDAEKNEKYYEGISGNFPHMPRGGKKLEDLLDFRNHYEHHDKGYTGKYISYTEYKQIEWSSSSSNVYYKGNTNQPLVYGPNIYGELGFYVGYYTRNGSNHTYDYVNSIWDIYDPSIYTPANINMVVDMGALSLRYAAMGYGSEDDEGVFDDGEPGPVRDALEKGVKISPIPGYSLSVKFNGVELTDCFALIDDLTDGPLTVDTADGPVPVLVDEYIGGIWKGQKWSDGTWHACDETDKHWVADIAIPGVDMSGLEGLNGCRVSDSIGDDPIDYQAYHVLCYPSGKPVKDKNDDGSEGSYVMIDTLYYGLWKGALSPKSELNGMIPDKLYETGLLTCNPASDYDDDPKIKAVIEGSANFAFIRLDDKKDFDGSYPLLDGNYPYRVQYGAEPVESRSPEYFEIHANATKVTTDKTGKVTGEERFHNTVTTKHNGLGFNSYLSAADGPVINGGIYGDSDGDGIMDWGGGLDGATSMDAGFWVGLSLLAERSDDDLIVEILGQKVCRTPSLVFLGDGEPTFMMSGMDIGDDALSNTNFSIKRTQSSGPIITLDFGPGYDYTNRAAHNKAIKDNGWWTFSNPLTENYYPYGTGSSFHARADSYYNYLYPKTFGADRTPFGDAAYRPNVVEKDGEEYGEEYYEYAYESDGGIAFATILRTALMKAAVNNRYQKAAEKAVNPDVKLGLYTIGVGLGSEKAGEEGAARATLDPGTYLVNGSNPVTDEVYKSWKGMLDAHKDGNADFTTEHSIYSTLKVNFSHDFRTMYDDIYRKGYYWAQYNGWSNNSILILWPDGWGYDEKEAFWEGTGIWKGWCEDNIQPTSAFSAFQKPIDQWFSDETQNELVREQVLNSDVFYYGYIDKVNGNGYHDCSFYVNDDSKDFNKNLGHYFFLRDDVRAYNIVSKFRDEGFKVYGMEESVPRTATFTMFPEAGVNVQIYGTSTDPKTVNVTADQFYDILENGYTDRYFDVSHSGELETVFEEIMTLITEEPFMTIGGANSLGETDKLTYDDPIGKYMTVDSVSYVTLFGHIYKVGTTDNVNYKIVAEIDPVTGKETPITTGSTTRVNKSYGSEMTFDLWDDIKIKVMKSGSQETLRINIGVNALPTQVASINLNFGVPVGYETNLSDWTASTPLRVFYNVSLNKDYLITMPDGRVAADANKVSLPTGYYVRGDDGFYNKVDQGGDEFVAFYSSIFSDSKYEDYPVMSDTNKTSRGDAMVTFSVGDENQFYRFQKNRVLFLIPGTFGLNERPAEIDLGDLSGNTVKYYVNVEHGIITADNGINITIDGDIVKFVELKPGNYEHLQVLLNAYRANLNWNGKGAISSEGIYDNSSKTFKLSGLENVATYWRFGDVMPVNGSILDRAEIHKYYDIRKTEYGYTKDNDHDDKLHMQLEDNLRDKGYVTDNDELYMHTIDADNWYYIIREFFYPAEFDDKGNATEVGVRYMAIARKGGELGSGVGTKDQEFVTWYDPVTGTAYEGFDSQKPGYGKPKSENELYIAATVGGLRVGGLANFAGVKGYDIREGVSDGTFTGNGEKIPSANVTETAMTYSLPTINSGSIAKTSDAPTVVVNVYLGNNGRILLPSYQPDPSDPEPDPKPEYGSLTITKTVVGGGEEAANKTYTFTVTGPNGYKKTVRLQADESVTLNNLVPGTYIVTEENAGIDGYKWTFTGTGTVKVTANRTTEVEVTNTYEAPGTGGLTITKTVVDKDGSIQEDDTEFTFNVTLTPPGGKDLPDGVPGSFTVTVSSGKPWSIDGLPAGTTYTVTEAVSDGYVFSGSTDDSGAIPEGSNATAAFTNKVVEPGKGDLTVSKTVDGDAGDQTKAFTFTVTLTPPDGAEWPEGVATTYTFTLTHGQSWSISGLPAGTTYTVTEAEADQDGYTTTESGSTGTIPSGGTASARFTNTKEEEKEPGTGDLTVSKTVGGSGGDQAKAFTFTVTLIPPDDAEWPEGVATTYTFTLTHGQSWSISGLPAGTTYTVTEAEADQDGYTTTESGSTGTIPSGGTATASFTNTKEEEKESDTGNLTVSKIVGGSEGNKNQEFHFAVVLSDRTVNGTYGGMTFVNGVARFTLRHGESVTATGLPSGITYSVMEQEAHQDGYYTASKGRDGTIPDQGTAQASFFNTRGEPLPDDPPLEEFDDPDIPLTGFPDFPDVPQTGDNSGIWLVLGLLSAIGLGVLYLSRPRKKDETE